MIFKRIYIEITNNCNLNCSFCSKTNRINKMMLVSEFEDIIKKVNKYTDYIYLHVKGEPLLYPYLEEVLLILEKYNKKVVITTNGTLLKEKLDILLRRNVYRINVSLHSENNKTNYLNDIVESIELLKSKTIISLRFWTLEENKMNSITKGYIDQLKSFYNINKIENNSKLSDNIYVSLDNKFDWPSDAKGNNHGYCHGGKNHIGILCDGTVVICCLDGNGESNLGNIFKSSIKDILSSEKYKNIISFFQSNKCYLELCKKCTFKDRFK